MKTKCTIIEILLKYASNYAESLSRIFPHIFKTIFHIFHLIITQFLPKTAISNSLGGSLAIFGILFLDICLFIKNIHLEPQKAK